MQCCDGVRRILCSSKVSCDVRYHLRHPLVIHLLEDYEARTVNWAHMHRNCTRYWSPTLGSLSKRRGIMGEVAQYASIEMNRMPNNKVNAKGMITSGSSNPSARAPKSRSVRKASIMRANAISPGKSSCLFLRSFTGVSVLYDNFWKAASTMQLAATGSWARIDLCNLLSNQGVTQTFWELCLPSPADSVEKESPDGSTGDSAHNCRKIDVAS